MAKRQRGGSRPGQRPPQRAAGRSQGRPAAPARSAAPARPAAAVRTDSLTADDLERAAALEAEIVAEERAAEATFARSRDRKRAAPDEVTLTRNRTRTSGGLAAVGVDEYRYVARDLRRIVLVFALIFGLLIVSFLVLIVGGVLK